MPGDVVFMRLGYNVDGLARLPWLDSAKCICWGDLDTHRFAILHRARSYIPELQSMLMDKETLLRHKALWVDEAAQHSAAELTLLTEDEQQLIGISSSSAGDKTFAWSRNGSTGMPHGACCSGHWPRASGL